MSHIGRTGKRGFRAALRRGGASKAAPICRDCQRENRFVFDLACFSGYARPSRGHLKCLARLMAQARGIQTGAYAEALLEQFEAAIAEVQEVIDSEKNSKDKKFFFQAVDAKKELLEAKAKALGLGASAGRPIKGTDLPVVDDISREDLRGVAETYLKAQEVAQPPPPPEAEPGEASDEPVSEQEMAEVTAEWLAWVEKQRAEGVSEGAEDEVAVVDVESSSHSG